MPGAARGREEGTSHMIEVVTVSQLPLGGRTRAAVRSKDRQTHKSLKSIFVLARVGSGFMASHSLAV